MTKQRFIPGLGAVRSQQVFKSLQSLLREAAKNFIEHYRTARRFSVEFPDVRDPSELKIVQAARAKYLRAKRAFDALTDLASAA